MCHAKGEVSHYLQQLPWKPIKTKDTLTIFYNNHISYKEHTNLDTANRIHMSTLSRDEYISKYMYWYIQIF